MEFLNFHDVNKSYGEVVAVRGVSFAVPAGEVFGLLGPNGAGKTTLIRILMDIIRADQGAVSIQGRPLARTDLDRIGYLPEERGLYKKQKVLEVMVYFGQLKGLPHAESRRRAMSWLERIGLPETAHWQVERLSKGMAQKIQIAATLFFDPELAVLDEPFSGLDPVNVRLIQELITERRNAGKTTILSAHQMNLVEALCDRVALINRGALMVYGEVDEVRRRYSLPEVRVGMTSRPPEVPGVEKIDEESPGLWRLRLAEGTGASGVLAALVGRGAEILRFEQVLAPMEDIFIRVVEGGRA